MINSFFFSGVDWKLYFHGRVFYERNCYEGELYNVWCNKSFSLKCVDAFFPGFMWLFNDKYHWILHSASSWSPAQLFFAHFKGYFHMFLLFVVSNKVCVHRKRTRECDRYIHGSRNFSWFYHFYFVTSYLRYFLHNVSTSSP